MTARVLNDTVQRAKKALDEIAKWPDAIEASAAIDDVGAHLTKHLEEAYAEAELLRASRPSKYGAERRG